MLVFRLIVIRQGLKKGFDAKIDFEGQVGRVLGAPHCSSDIHDISVALPSVFVFDRVHHIGVPEHRVAGLQSRAAALQRHGIGVRVYQEFTDASPTAAIP